MARRREVLAQTLLLDRLLPLAKSGPRPRGRRPGGQRGATWGILELAHPHDAHRLSMDPRLPQQAMKDRGTQGARLTALTAAMIARQKTDAVGGRLGARAARRERQRAHRVPTRCRRT
ncbi:MAG: hypothetical protein IPF99_37735 [Deltaproteobacteria bacterium]|nr:hypothetical protein [Deltaproteobacteria bacterium]